MNNKIKRNEPCPCGSGKKYKKCCIHKPIENIQFNDNLNLQDNITNFCILNPDSIPDRIILSNDFFSDNQPLQISAQNLIYFKMLHPASDKALSDKVREITNNRARAEEDEIKKHKNNPDKLISLLNSEIDPLNQQLMRIQLLKFKNDVIPRFINMLINNMNDMFIENSLRIIFEADDDHSEQLIFILDKTQNPYTLSLICLFLGLMECADSIPYLWKYFHFFKFSNYQERFDQGPLIALIHLWNKLPEEQLKKYFR